MEDTQLESDYGKRLATLEDVHVGDRAVLEGRLLFLHRERQYSQAL